MPKENVKRITTIGGQALIEGVMMKGPRKTRHGRLPDGTIDPSELSRIPCGINTSSGRFRFCAASPPSSTHAHRLFGSRRVGGEIRPGGGRGAEQI